MKSSGPVWYGVVWSGLVWSGPVWSLVWSGMVWSGQQINAIIIICRSVPMSQDVLLYMAGLFDEIKHRADDL